MTLTVKMPLGIHSGFMGHCLLSSRDYTALKNSVIEHRPGNASLVEILCDVVEANLMLDLALKFYHPAVPFIEQAIENLVIPGYPTKSLK
jgi:hypothetical protein